MPAGRRRRAATPGQRIGSKGACWMAMVRRSSTACWKAGGRCRRHLYPRATAGHPLANDTTDSGASPMPKECSAGRPSCRAPSPSRRSRHAPHINLGSCPRPVNRLHTRIYFRRGAERKRSCAALVPAVPWPDARPIGPILRFRHSSARSRRNRLLHLLNPQAMPDPSASTEEMDRLFQPRSACCGRLRSSPGRRLGRRGRPPRRSSSMSAPASFDADDLRGPSLAGNPAIPSSAS